MPDRPISSNPPLEKGLQCGFEDLVCIDKPEYHEDTINKECDPEVMVVVEYKETEKGIQEIVKVDEKKALAKRAISFEEKKTQSKEKKEKKFAKEDQDINAYPQAMPHFHNGEIANLSPQGETTPVLASPSIPLSALLCYCPTDTSDSIAPPTHAIVKPERVVAKEFSVEGQTAVLGLLFSTREVEIYRAVTKAASFDFNAARRGPSYSVVWAGFHFIAMQREIEFFSAEKSKDHPKDATRSPLKGEEPLPISLRHSESHYFSYISAAIENSSPQDPQGSGVIFSLGTYESRMEQSLQIFVVLEPSDVTPRQDFIRTAQLNEGEPSKKRVHRGQNTGSSKGYSSGHDRHPHDKRQNHQPS